MNARARRTAPVTGVSLKELFDRLPAALGSTDVVRSYSPSIALPTLNADRSMIIAEPGNLARDDSVIEATARNRGVMVVFMGLSRMKKLVPLFRKHFAATTPVHLVYDAGIAGRARRVKTTLGAVVQEIGRQEETFLGLVYIGAGLR